MEDVTLEVDGHVAVMTLNAARRRNALTRAMAYEMASLLDEVNHDRSVGALVIRGAGGHFCAGAHRDALDEIAEDPAEPERFELNGAVYEAFAKVSRSNVPVVAAVEGAAVGAGVNLLLAADLRIVAEDARIIAGFLRIGIHPGGGHFVLAGRLLSSEAVAALALFSEEISGVRAVEIGLAWAARPADEVQETAMSLARRPAADPDLARMTVASMRTELGPPMSSLDVALQAERGSQMWSLRRRGLKAES